MPGTAIILPGTGPGTGPTIPLPLHSAGVNTYNHRWVGARAVGALNGPLTSWPDEAGTMHLTGPTNTALKLKQTGDPARRYAGRLSADGTAVGTLSSSGTAPALTPTTIVAVLRVPAPTGSINFLRTQGIILRRVVNGSWQALGSTSGNVTLPGSDNWALLVVHAAHATSQVQMWVDGSTGSSLATISTPAASTYIGANGALTADCAELITYPGLLGSTDRAAIRTALKAQYPFLP